MATVAKGTFEVEMTPGEAEIEGEVRRFEIEKVFQGDLVGTSRGVMMAGGDPEAGSAGYVAMEVVSGQIDGRTGSFALFQLGSMRGGESNLRYEVVPGSGQDGYEGMTGLLHLTIEDDGTHRYELEFEV
jgi:hypothetical protein